MDIKQLSKNAATAVTITILDKVDFKISTPSRKEHIKHWCQLYKRWQNQTVSKSAQYFSSPGPLLCGDPQSGTDPRLTASSFPSKATLVKLITD